MLASDGRQMLGSTVTDLARTSHPPGETPKKGLVYLIKEIVMSVGRSGQRGSVQNVRRIWAAMLGLWSGVRDGMLKVHRIGAFSGFEF